MRDSFVFYKTWFENIEDEKQEVQWEIIHAIMEYVFRGNLVELKPNAKMAFKFIKRDIDRADENYQKYIQTQSNNGKKGGRPRKENKIIEDKLNPFLENQRKPMLYKETEKTEPFSGFSEKSQKSLNVNVKDNVNVNENVNNTSSYNAGEVSETKNFLKGNQIQMDRLMMQHKLSREQIHEKIDEFVEKKVSWGENDWKNTSDLSRNFEFWLGKSPKTTQEGKKPRSVF